MLKSQNLSQRRNMLENKEGTQFFYAFIFWTLLIEFWTLQDYKYWEFWRIEELKKTEDEKVKKIGGNILKK